MLNHSKLNRLVLFCEQTWAVLSEPERENYYSDTGIIGFVEDCMKILRIYQSELSVEQMDNIVNCLLDKEHGLVYGSYIPTDDITVIFEEFHDEDGEPMSLFLRGFYYGGPDDDSNKSFYKDYDAYFD